MSKVFRRRDVRVVCLLLASLLALGSANAATEPVSGRTAVSLDFDIRTAVDEKEAVEALEQLRTMHGASARGAADARIRREAAEDALRDALGDVDIQRSRPAGGPSLIAPTVGRRALTAPSEASRETIARAFIEDHAGVYGLSRAQATRLRVDADYENPAGNLGWLRLIQEVEGRPVFGAGLTFAITPAGEIARVVGELVGDFAVGQVATSAVIGADAAILAAAAAVELDVQPWDLRRIEGTEDDNVLRYAVSSLADQVNAEQVYFGLDRGVLERAWTMTLWTEIDVWYVVVGASDGTVLWWRNLTDYETHDYSVYEGSSPAPFLPGPTDPTLGEQAPRVAAVNLTVDSQQANGDPWLDPGETTTDGNNVEAGLDIDGTDGVDAPVPESGPNQFLYSSNPPPGIPAPGEAPTTTDSRNAAVVNLFYWSNRFHNLTYDLGFTESALNFQDDNYGRGGVGGDRVRAEAQDSSGTNNANFSTPADGGRGRMQMYVFTGPDPDRDGSFDADIVIHELTHGLSNRLHGNATGLSSNMARGMGEGWSDFYAHSFLAKPTDPLAGIYTTGGYSTLGISDPANTGNYYYGIRRFPKAIMSFTGGPLNRPHNPLTFADIDSTQIDITDGAYPRGPIGSSTADQVHNAGEVWSSALWEARAKIIERMGFEDGNQRMLQLVTDGMKLNPAAPDFIQARDSIIAADCATYGGSSELDLWAGFAIRGMGFGAEVLSSASPARVIESFSGPQDGNLPFGVNAANFVNVSCPVGGRNPIPGEEVEIIVDLANPLCGTALTNTVAAVTGGTSQDLGTVAAGGVATATLRYVIPASTACGDTIQAEVTVTHDLGNQTIMVDLPVGPRPIGTTSFTNATPISLPSGAPTTTSGPADPYPSTITVPGTFSETVTGVRVTLNDFSHSWSEDVDVLLEGPTGATMVVLSDAFGNTRTTFPQNATITLRDDAAEAVPKPFQPINASYRPTNFGSGDPFDAPAPTSPYAEPETAGSATFASVFGGLNPVGDWRLWIDDDAGSDSGSIAGGWTLTLVYAQPAVCAACTVGLDVVESDGTTEATEGAAPDSYDLALLTEPTDPVTVELSFDPALITVNGETDGDATVVFNPGSGTTPQTVTVAAFDDAIVETPTKSAVIMQTISSTDPVYGVLDPADLTVTVNDNDMADVSFAAGDDTVPESAVLFSKPVILSISGSGTGPATLENALSVPVIFGELEATEPEDFDVLTAMVDFAAGAPDATSVDVETLIVDDDVDEVNERFTLELMTAGAPSNVTFTRSATTVTILAPQISATKTSNPASGTTVLAGTTITYTLTLDVTNGPTAAPVVLTDTLDADLVNFQLVSNTGGFTPGGTNPETFTLAAGAATGTYVVEYSVDVAATASGSVGNSVLAAGGGGPDPDCPSCTTSHPIADPVIVANKTSDPISDTEVTADQTITYTLTATITDAALTADLVLTDTLGAGLTFGAVTVPGAYIANTAGNPLAFTLPSGTVPGDYSVEYTVTVNDDATGSVGNSVLAAGGGGPDPDCPSCTTSHPIADPGIVANKTSDPISDTEVTADQTITYTLTATITDAALTADLVLSDTLGAGLTFDAVTVPGDYMANTAGNPLTFTLPSGTVPGDYSVEYTVTVNDDATGSVGNSVVASGGGGPDPDCPSCTTSHPIADPGIVANKTSDPISDTEVTADQTITYTLTATITDAALTADLVLSDTLGAGLTFDAVTVPGDYMANTAGNPLTFTLPSGTVPGDYSVEYTVTVNDDATGSVGNSVGASGGGGPDPDCPSCTTSHPIADPGIVANKTSDPISDTEVTADQTITYTLTATITDAALTADLVLSDTLGAGLTFDAVTVPGDYMANTAGNPLTFTLPSGTVPGDYSVEYTVTVNDDATGSVGNSVLAAGGGGPDPDCPSCTTSHPIADPGIVANKSSDLISGTEVTAGQTITYTLAATITDAALTADLVLTDTLGAGLTFDAVTVPGDYMANTAGNPLTFTLPSGTVPGDYSVEYTATVDNTASGSVVNSVGAAGGGGPDPECPSCTTSYPIADPVIVANTSADPVNGSTVAVGDTITYTLTATITDAALTADLVLTDTLGAGLTFGAVTVPGAYIANTAGNPLTFTLPSGTVPGDYSVEYTVTVDNTASGSVGNSVGAAGGGDPDPDCSSCTTSHPVFDPIPVSSLSLTGILLLIMLVLIAAGFSGMVRPRAWGQ